MKKVETLAELREMRRTSQEDLALSLGVAGSTGEFIGSEEGPPASG